VSFPSESSRGTERTRRSSVETHFVFCVCGVGLGKNVLNRFVVMVVPLRFVPSTTTFYVLPIRDRNVLRKPSASIVHKFSRLGATTPRTACVVFFVFCVFQRRVSESREPNLFLSPFPTLTIGSHFIRGAIIS